MSKKSNQIIFSTHDAIQNLLDSEAIVRRKSRSFIINEIIEAHYTNSTLIHKKLNWIMKNIKNADKIPFAWVDENVSIFDVPKVNIDEIKASKYKQKGRYNKKIEVAVPEVKVKSVFDIANFGMSE